MKYFVILLIFAGSAMLVPNAFGLCDSLPCDNSPMQLEENFKFINFSYFNTVGEPLQFIIEKPSDRNCNSYDAKITDDEGNFILSWGADISCDPVIFSSLVQTKIGYNENKPIIINESGKYYLEVAFVDAITKREFVVRHNQGGGGSLDRTVYPIPFDVPSPHEQMKLGIKLGHVICDKDKTPVWNTHNKPACVFPDTESELLSRGWAKLRLMLPASPFPEKEMEWTGRNIMLMMLEGTFSYSSTSVETLDDKRKAIEEYSEQYHQGEKYLEYAITPYQYHYNVGDKVQFELLEWGKSSDCSNLTLRIIDMYDQSVFEHIPITGCVGTDIPLVIFNSYSMGDDFEEFVCDKTGYYRIEVSNGDMFSPTILQNFACLDNKPEPDVEPSPEPEPSPIPEGNYVDKNTYVYSIHEAESYLNYSLGTPYLPEGTELEKIKISNDQRKATVYYSNGLEIKHNPMGINFNNTHYALNPEREGGKIFYDFRGTFAEGYEIDEPNRPHYSTITIHRDDRIYVRATMDTGLDELLKMIEPMDLNVPHVPYTPTLDYIMGAPEPEPTPEPEPENEN